MAEPMMADLVAQFRKLLGLVDSAAIGAARVQSLAGQANSAFVEASLGTTDPLMSEARTKSQIATDKAGKTARLLSEAADHFTTYVNRISPGAMTARTATPDAMPSGEQLTEQAAQRTAGLLDAMFRKSDDVKDTVNETVKYVVDGSTAAAHQLQKVSPPSPPPAPPAVPPSTASGVPTDTTTYSHTALEAVPSTNVTINDAVAAVVVTVVGATVVSRAAVNQVRKKKQQKESDGDKG